MNDDRLEILLRRSLSKPKAAGMPGFDRLFAAAELTLARSRRRRRAGGAMVVASAAAVLWFTTLPEPATEPDFDFAIETSLLTGTLWRAPSDSLMPSHPFDIYESLPAPAVSTELQEGTLL